MDRGAWWATVHGVTKSRRRLKQLATAHGTWLSYKIILVSGVQLGIHHFYRLYPMYWRRDRLLTPVFLGFPGILVGKESACNAGDLGSIPVEDPLEEGKATHSRILAWRIPWTVLSMGSQRFRHD